MPSIYDLYVYLLEPVDLNGKSHKVIIESASVENVFNPRAHKAEPALVLVFKRARKHMKLNKTQAKAVMQIAGTDDYTLWDNTELILTPTEATNGRLTIAITAPAAPTYEDLESGHEGGENGTA